MPRGIKPVRRTLATGEERTYYYHRVTGERVHNDPHSAAGLLEIDDLDRKAAKISEAATPGGTFAALWLSYRGRDEDSASEEWKALAPRTRSDYQAVRDWIGPAAEKMVIRRVTDDDLIKLRDKAARQRGRRFGNYVIQVVRLVFEWGRSRGWFGRGERKAANPAKGIKSIRRPKGARKVNRAWDLREVEEFAADDCPFQLLVPFALGLFAGMRQGDALRETKRAYSGVKLSWKARKNGEQCEAPVTGVFKVILDAAVKRGGTSTQLAVTSNGTPWTESGFRASFFKRVRKLQAAGRMRPGATFHGLRYTVVSSARDDGANDFKAAAAIGDRTTAMAELYGRDADRIAAQAMVLEGVQKRYANISVENVFGKRPRAPRGKGR